MKPTVTGWRLHKTLTVGGKPSSTGEMPNFPSSRAGEPVCQRWTSSGFKDVSDISCSYGSHSGYVGWR
ncbi:hypothetical protein DPMN_053434 [Dreissena polymorpha]|uniref:Uncharacterized protein n=1 Tax=Dreissena polymorpha TaxID=45954 RepID=A0A9D4HQP7_DREPO|nr:hypothetical protein DPMN_053434 [Dreissena polymorpha]